MSLALSLYLALTSVSAPFARLVLKRRLALGKEDAARLPERMGKPSIARPSGPLVWCHAASVGESLSLLPLIECLRAEKPQLTVLVTSGTVTSARLLAERLPDGAFHQFAPIDVRPAVERFLDHWRPDVAVWIESEIWPRLLHAVEARDIPALLLNARLSARSRTRWRRAPKAAGRLFSIFDHVQVQDPKTAAALHDLGVPPERLDVAGSFKAAAAPLPCDHTALAALEAAVRGRLVWVAASTHPGEEELMLEAHSEVLSERRDALLVLVPRHPERGEAVAHALVERHLPFARRSTGVLPTHDHQILLGDTLGELGLWYRLSLVAFVAGSFAKVGGHNPYEPAALNVPIIHGPKTENFADVYAALDSAGGAVRVASPRELARAVIDISADRTGLEIATRAAKVIRADSEALDRAARLILARLPSP